jgi:hypothetical protein
MPLVKLAIKKFISSIHDKDKKRGFPTIVETISYANFEQPVLETRLKTFDASEIDKVLEEVSK